LKSFDYIVVGGGAAGCVLANRLTEDGITRVLLLEAGGRDDSLLIRMPAGVAKVWKNPNFNWSFYSQPEPFADDRRIFHPRGKVLGGSSSINMMSYVRGHRFDFERWSSKGAKGWSYEDILPYFKRAEDYDKKSKYRGIGGPLRITENASPDEVYEAFLEAGSELGYAIQDDYNGPEQDGFARMQQLARAGRRSSASAAYLWPARKRANLEVCVRSHATRILFSGSRAVGVEYVVKGQAERVAAAKEVIVSCGALSTPQLLLLSGIGPSDQLRTAGVDAIVDLPGVGSNLHDHPQVDVSFERRGQSRMRRELRADRLALSVVRSELFGTGFASEALGGVTAFIRSSPAEVIPNLEFFCVPGALSSHPWFPIFRASAPERITFKTALLRPESTGHVTLGSADPFKPPRIQTNFLGSERDRAALREGVRLCRTIASTRAFKDLVGDEIAPSHEVRSDAQIDAFVRRTVESIYHPCGTCRMGEDDGAVVDSNLRVRGVEGLRVVDASVMPDNIGATINAPVAAIAERAADLIRGIVPERAAGL
jgi:4-pyridoxate dehydrogenase